MLRQSHTEISSFLCIAIPWVIVNNYVWRRNKTHDLQPILIWRGPSYWVFAMKLGYNLRIRISLFFPYVYNFKTSICKQSRYKTVQYNTVHYFHVSNSSLLFTKYSGTILVHKRSLGAFYHWTKTAVMRPQNHTWRSRVSHCRVLWKY